MTIETITFTAEIITPAIAACLLVGGVGLAAIWVLFDDGDDK